MKLRLFVIVLVCWSMIQAPRYVWASGSGPFEFSTCSYDNNAKVIVLKLNKITGETWIFNKQSFEAISENRALPSSNYKVMIKPLKQGWFAMRLDTMSGKTWKLRKGLWVEYK